MRRGVGVSAVSLLLLGTFGISLSYGMLLLLPLYVRELGGNEADFGVVLSSAAVPARPRGTFGISLSSGMLLLLPLYVRELGGNEADFGVVLSSAAVPAVLCIGLLIRYPEVFRPHSVV